MQKQREFHCGETWSRATSMSTESTENPSGNLVVGLTPSFFSLCVAHQYSPNLKAQCLSGARKQERSRMQDFSIRIYKTES